MENSIIYSDFSIIHGDARQVLEYFPDNHFQSVITSPPYWGLRDYGVDGQIGSEIELTEYIENLTDVFRQVWRVLSPDGILWLNIGDSYTSGNRTWRAPDKKNKGRAMSYRPPTPKGLKKKELIGVPWRVAFSLQNDGWYLRSDIVWNKPNCQPESVKDRPTHSHEYLFMLTKSERYFFDHDVIKESAANGNGLKARRSVWSIMTKGYSEAHFAVFPRELVRLCVIASTREGNRILDPFLGSGTSGVVAREYNRRFTGIELKKEYVEMAEKRVSKVPLSLFLNS